ncbi:TPR repeat region-containing protein [Nocardia concava]|uniref:TPR repeat region-containing protein n=1 Tax=Nocardia concava TaxID=257281 RepID=UPI00030F7573|nr:hypothetical protein [Nocardia concava]
MTDTPTPKVSEVKNWQLSTLADQGTYWTQQAGKLKTELDGVQTNVGNSVDYIVGKFGTGLRDKGLTVRDEGYKTVGALETAGGAVSVGMQGLDFAQKSVTQLVTTIEAEKYLVGEEGDVVLSLAQIASALSDKDNGTVKLAVLQRQADEYSKSLKAALTNAGTMAQAVANGINEAFQQLPNAGNGTGPVSVTAASGEELGEKVKDSDQIPPEVMSQIDQILDQIEQSPEDLAKLRNGETLVVPASTLEFTQKFLDAAGPEGFEKLSEQLRAQGPEGQKYAQELGNSFMLLSNEHVKGVKADGKQVDGGYEQLPQAYQDIISSRVNVGPNDQQPDHAGFMPDSNTSRFPDPNDLGQYRAQTKYYENLQRLTSALDVADTNCTPGTKLSTELYRQGGQLAAIVNANGDGGLTLPTGKWELDKSISNIVDIGTRNVDATSIIITGDGTPAQLGADYHRDSTMTELIRYDWPNGVENSPMNKMFDWITQDAKVDVPQGDPNYQHQLDEANRAGKSARALADIVSSTKSPDGANTFNALFNDKNTSMRYVAEALSPYVGNMAGVDEKLVGTHGFGNLNPVEATRIFTLADGDPKAAGILNGAAIAQAYEFDKSFALGEGGNDLALYSGRLRGLVEGGLAADIGLHHYDDQTAANHRKETYGATFMGAKEFFNAAVSTGVDIALDEVPGKKLVMPLVNTMEAYLKDPTINALNDSPKLSYPVLNFEKPDGTLVDLSALQTDERDTAAHRYVMLQSLVDSGRIDPATLPHNLSDGTSLLPFSQVKDSAATKIPQILEQHGMDPDRLQQYMDDSRAGSNVVDQKIFGGKMVQPGSELYIPVLRAGAAPASANKWE